jgi:hypothetical protein
MIIDHLLVQFPVDNLLVIRQISLYISPDLNIFIKYIITVSLNPDPSVNIVIPGVFDNIIVNLFSIFSEV